MAPDSYSLMTFLTNGYLSETNSLSFYLLIGLRNHFFSFIEHSRREERERIDFSFSFKSFTLTMVSERIYVCDDIL